MGATLTKKAYQQADSLVVCSERESGFGDSVDPFGRQWAQKKQRQRQESLKTVSNGSLTKNSQGKKMDGAKNPWPGF